MTSLDKIMCVSSQSENRLKTNLILSCHSKGKVRLYPRKRHEYGILYPHNIIETLIPVSYSPKHTVEVMKIQIKLPPLFPPPPPIRYAVTETIWRGRIICTPSDYVSTV